MILIHSYGLKREERNDSRTHFKQDEAIDDAIIRAVRNYRKE